MSPIGPRQLLLTLVALGGLVGCSAVLPPGFGQSSPPPAAVAGAPSFKGEITSTLKLHCASCHSIGGMGASSLEMFDATGKALHPTIKARMVDMIQAIRSGYMPKGKPGSVSAEQIQQLDAWRNAGGPDN